MQRQSPAMQKVRQMQDTAMIAGVMSSFKQFERKLDKLADNVRWQGATLAELRALVSGVNRPGDMRAVSTQCDVRGRRRQALQPMGHPIHAVNTVPATAGGGHGQLKPHRRTPIILPLPSPPHPKRKHRRRHHPTPTRRHQSPARRHISPTKRGLLTVMPRKIKESKKHAWVN